MSRQPSASQGHLSLVSRTRFVKALARLLLGLAGFLVLDALLAMVLGRRYMVWGLDRTPASYRAMVERLVQLPQPAQWAVKLAEGVLGLALLRVARGQGGERWSL